MNPYTEGSGVPDTCFGEGFFSCLSGQHLQEGGGSGVHVLNIGAGVLIAPTNGMCSKEMGILTGTWHFLSFQTGTVKERAFSTWVMFSLMGTRV